MKTGKVFNRDSFLENLTNKLGRDNRRKEVEPLNFHVNPQYEILKNASKDELIDILIEESKKVNTDVHVTPSVELSSLLENLLKELNGKSIITTDDTRFEEYGLDHMLHSISEEGSEVWKWGDSTHAESIKFAEQADVGIVFSDYALAESATVVLESSAKKGRSVSLLPTCFIAVIPKSTIVARLTQVAERVQEQGEDIPSCIKFISGPSNSGDIEMNLVVGVHGPIKATYVIVNDQ